MKNSYYGKIKRLLSLIVLVPLLILTIGVYSYMEKQLDIDINVLILLLTLSIEIIITFLMSKDITGFFDEEIHKIKTCNSFDLGNEKLENKIEKLNLANEKIEQLLFTVIDQENALSKEKEHLEDLSQQKLSRLDNLNDEIRMQSKLNESLLELTSHFLIQINLSGIILKMNKAFTMRLGYTHDELIGKNILDYIRHEKEDSSEEAKIEFLNRIINSQSEPLFISMQMKATNLNATEYISIKSTMLSDDTLLCIGRAINDEISLQSNILRKNRELEYINQINSSLLSNSDIETLLDNIIKRIDYLFNIKLGGIYVLDDNKNWQLKSFASKSIQYEEIVALNLTQYFTDDMLLNALIKTIETPLTDLKYMILSPLEVDNEIIALLVIALNQEMNTNDINILKMFKNQASMVIQRALIYDQLRKQYFGTIEALVNVIEAKDKYTEGHSRRVSRFAVEIAKEMGYSNEEIENIEIAGLLHDVGKIGIEQNILAKRGKLTDYEYEIIKEHPTKGIQVLNAINFDEKIKDGILYHHLRYDLKGYPKVDLTVQPLYARVIEIADAFDAITSARSYSKAKTKEDALLELIKHEGSQFAPEMVQVFIKMITENPERLQNIIDDIEVVHLN